MKKPLIGLLAAGVLLGSVPAIAQQQKAPAPTVAIPKNTFVRGQEPGQYLAKDRLIGAKVQNKDGAIIGDIEDLIVTRDNEIVGVVMGTGGFLGAGEKKVGVRLSALQITTKDGKLMVSLPQASKEVLAALEPFKRAEPKKSLTERAKEKAKELSDKTKETTKDAAAAAKEKAGPALEKAKDAAGAAYEKAKDAASSAMEKAKDATKPAEPKQ